MDKRNLDTERALEYFPCLEKIMGRNGINLCGYLISKRDMNDLLLSKREVQESSEWMKVYCVVPDNYLEIGCQIKDVNGFIDWDKVPYEHKHINSTINGDKYLCTHLIEEVHDMNNPILENLKTAYVLSIEYKRYLKNGKYELKEYSHGNEGRKEYVNRRRDSNKR